MFHTNEKDGQKKNRNFSLSPKKREREIIEIIKKEQDYVI